MLCESYFETVLSQTSSLQCSNAYHATHAKLTAAYTLTLSNMYFMI